MNLTEPPAGLAGGGDGVPAAGAVPPPVPKPVAAPPLSEAMPPVPVPVPKPTPELRAAYVEARRRQRDDPAEYAGSRPEVAPLAGDPGRRGEFVTLRYKAQQETDPGGSRVFTRTEAAQLARALNGAPERGDALNQLAGLTEGVPASAVARELREAGLAPELGAVLVLARDPARARLVEGLTQHADAAPDDAARQRFAGVFGASPQGRALEAALAEADEDRRADLEGLRAAVLETGARCTAGLTKSHEPEGAAHHARTQCLAPALEAFAEAFGVEPEVFQAPVPQAEPSIAGTEIPEAVIADDAEAHRLREAARARVAELHDAGPAPFQAEAGRVRDLIVGEGSAAARKAAIREALALTGPNALPGASDSGRFYLNREAASLIDRIEAGELSPEAAQAAFDATLQEVRDNYAAVNEIGGILLDFVPLIGDVKGLNEAAESLQEAVELLRQGRYTAAGIALSGVAAGAIGLIPGVGDAAKIAIDRLGKLARRRLRKGVDDVGVARATLVNGRYEIDGALRQPTPERTNNSTGRFLARHGEAGFWEEARGNGNYWPNPDRPAGQEALSATGGAPIKFIDGEPDFSPWAKAEFKLPFGGDAYLFHNQTKAWIVERLVQEGRFPSAVEAQKWIGMKRLDMHHVGDGETVLLVPREIHGNIPHDGRAFFKKKIGDS